MELKTLWLGLLVSLIAFSVKTGLGWSYLWLQSPRRARLGLTLGLAALYGALFAAVLFAVSRINILAHYEILAPLWQGGVTLHWLVAALLALWGLLLLRAPASAGPHGDRRSQGYLALVIPCPVCLSVILMSLGGLVLYFPEKAAQATALLYLAFLTVAGAAGLALIWGRKGGEEPLERSLGIVMILIASYFIISALVTPQFASVERIYRLASYSQENGTRWGLSQALSVGAIVALLVAGFWRGWRARSDRRGRAS